MTHVLAIDQGTTGTTCLVVAADGGIVGRAYREITQHYPQPGWVEHDATEILDKTIAAAQEAVKSAGVLPRAIGITNQRETVVVWDRTAGTPVGRAIVWQDRRTAERCRELASRAPDITARTGLVVDPYFSATKLEWLLRDDTLARRARGGELLAGTIDSWLIWRLTGGSVHATDPTNASRTMLYDIDQLAWSDELCALFGVPRTMLPEVRPSSGSFGETTRELFGTAIPITGVAGDQQAALFGQGAFAPGEAKCTYGTGAFFLQHLGEKATLSRHRLLTTVAWRRGECHYALEGGVFMGGATVQWLRDGLGIIGTAAETEPLARSVASNDGVYFVPALVGLGAPDWEPNARGTIVGLTRGATRAHLARAALEAMTYATRDVLDVMRTSAGGGLDRWHEAPLRVDGGATANDWLMQFQADVLDKHVERPQNIETTALGAAGLAGLATGVWKSPEDFLRSRSFSKFSPRDTERAARDHAGWRRAVRTALAWARDRD
jgi:glycerol kinase